MQNLLEEHYEELVVLNAEVPKAIMGKSAFKPEMLNALIEKKKTKF